MTKKNQIKIERLKKEILHLKESINNAKKNNKIHFANRLKIIMERKQTLINKWSNLRHF
jgi:hypothetical protein